jgi:hypothetical protein
MGFRLELALVEAHGHRRAVYKVVAKDCLVSQDDTDLQTVAVVKQEEQMTRTVMER